MILFLFAWLAWFIIFTLFGDRLYGWLTENIVMSLFAVIMTYAVVVFVNLIFQ